MPESSGASLANISHLESGTETHPGGKKSAGGSVSANSADARKKGAMGSVLLICHSPQAPHHPHLQFCRLVCFPIFGSMEKHYFQQVCTYYGSGSPSSA